MYDFYKSYPNLFYTLNRKCIITNGSKITVNNIYVGMKINSFYTALFKNLLRSRIWKQGLEGAGAYKKNHSEPDLVKLFRGSWSHSQ